MIRITDIDDPRVRHFRSLRHSSIANDEGYIIAESEKVVLRLLESSITPTCLFLQDECYERHRDLLDACNINDESIMLAEKSVMSSIVGYVMHQGMLAIAPEPANIELLHVNTPAVALHGIADSENMGSIIRNCRAFGIRTLITDQQCCSPWLRRSIRVSMGAIFDLQVHRCEQLSAALTQLKQKRRTTIIACENVRTARDVHTLAVDRNSVLVFGSEGHGIDEDVLDLSDDLVQIEMAAGSQSLNVASASAIILEHLFRSMNSEHGLANT